MSTVNVMAREIAAKIVFYGPGLSGKTTTLKRVYDSVKPAHRGELMALPTEADRTLFFDFLPVKVERVHDYSARALHRARPGLLQRDPEAGVAGRRRGGVRRRFAAPPRKTPTASRCRTSKKTVSSSPLRVDDAAFALFVLMQTFHRLAQAGLPHPES